MSTHPEREWDAGEDGEAEPEGSGGAVDGLDEAERQDVIEKARAELALLQRQIASMREILGASDDEDDSLDDGVEGEPFVVEGWFEEDDSDPEEDAVHRELADRIERDGVVQFAREEAESIEADFAHFRELFVKANDLRLEEPSPAAIATANVAPGDDSASAAVPSAHASGDAVTAHTSLPAPAIPLATLSADELGDDHFRARAARVECDGVFQLAREELATLESEITRLQKVEVDHEAFLVRRRSRRRFMTAASAGVLAAIFGGFFVRSRLQPSPPTPNIGPIRSATLHGYDAIFASQGAAGIQAIFATGTAQEAMHIIRWIVDQQQSSLYTLVVTAVSDARPGVKLYAIDGLYDIPPIALKPDLPALHAALLSETDKKTYAILKTVIRAVEDA
jgi:hypothetical protein